MAPRKLPPGLKQIHVGVSMPPETWAQIQFIAVQRGRASASSIVREAVAEYLARRFGPAPVPERDGQAVVA